MSIFSDSFFKTEVRTMHSDKYYNGGNTSHEKNKL